MPIALENRIGRLEQAGNEADTAIHFFTVKTQEDEAAMKHDLEQLPPKAVVFITRYEAKPTPNHALQIQ